MRVNFVHGGIENTSAAIVPNQFLSQLDSEVLQRGKCGIGGKLLVEDVAVGDGNVTGYGKDRGLGRVTVDVTARLEEPAMVACRGEQIEEVTAPGSEARIIPGTVV